MFINLIVYPIISFAIYCCHLRLIGHMKVWEVQPCRFLYYYYIVEWISTSLPSCLPCSVSLLSVSPKFPWFRGMNPICHLCNCKSFVLGVCSHRIEKPSFCSVVFDGAAIIKSRSRSEQRTKLKSSLSIVSHLFKRKTFSSIILWGVPLLLWKPFSDI